MPTNEIQGPEIYSVSFGFLPKFLQEAKKLQTKERFDQAWDRHMPGGETAHRLLVEPIAVAYSGFERVIAERSTKAKSALVLGAAALSTGLGVLAAARRSS